MMFAFSGASQVRMSCDTMVTREPQRCDACSACRCTTALGFFSTAYTRSGRCARSPARSDALTSGPLPAPTTMTTTAPPPGPAASAGVGSGMSCSARKTASSYVLYLVSSFSNVS
jgi:hypothetical protein